MNLAVTEADVLKGTIALMGLRGFRPTRMNSGALVNKQGRPVAFGFKGAPDVWGIVPRTLGRLIVVECKRPGGKLRVAQREVLQTLREAGAVAVVISDLGRLEEVLATLAGSPNALFDLAGEIEGLAFPGGGEP